MKRRARWAAQWAEPGFQERVDREIEAQSIDPFSYSELRYWLSLDVWTNIEGLLILAGIEPETVITSGWGGVLESDAEWNSAQPFDQHFSFSAIPLDPFTAETDFGGNRKAYQDYLESCERTTEVLRSHKTRFDALRHKFDHSVDPLGPGIGPNTWRPIAFVSWAKSIGFEPNWLAWAVERGHLLDGLHPEARPFFDADSDQYPELLVIAIRAWESACKGGEGTPKQRVDRFLRERYPNLTGSTRDAIALVVNWQKAGGRPAKS